MSQTIELLKIILPAGLVLYAAYLMVRSILSNRLAELNSTLRQKNQEVVSPIRLQAYERVVLLLERISPANFVSRISSANLTAKEYQSVLINEIREEYNHNLSQQLYMSDEAWSYVSGTVEDTISSINEVAQGLNEESQALELVQGIFEKDMQKNSHRDTISFLKREIQALF